MFSSLLLVVVGQASADRLFFTQGIVEGSNIPADADNLCATEATAGSAVGVWKAIYSTLGQTAKTRVANANPDYPLRACAGAGCPPGNIIAFNETDLWDGMLSEAVHSVSGALGDGCVWTSTNTDGSGAGSRTWSSITGANEVAGEVSSTAAEWVFAANMHPATQCRVYCVKVGDTPAPTGAPTGSPTESPAPTTGTPTEAPTEAPTTAPTDAPTSASPTPIGQTGTPTGVPTKAPTNFALFPTDPPTEAPTSSDPPSAAPTAALSSTPTSAPTSAPTGPTVSPPPTWAPTTDTPTTEPTVEPTADVVTTSDAHLSGVVSLISAVVCAGVLLVVV